MKLTKEELISRIKAYTGDRTDDDTLSLMEDVSDSLTVDDSEDWHTKYDDLAKKYKDRFTESVKIDDDKKDDEKEEEVNEDITTDDLFSDKEEEE